MTIGWQYLYLFTFFAGALLALGLTPVFKKIAVLTDFMDRPKGEAHKGHGKATPLLGGASMLSAWLIVIVGGMIFIKFFNPAKISPQLAENVMGIKMVSGRLFFICLGAVMGTVLGLLDDKFGMPAKVKFSGQFLVAAVAVILGGIRISVFFSNPIIVCSISIFWFMMLMNAINFFDNMDSLAVGTVTIAMGLFTAVAVVNQQYFIAAIGAVSCGVGVGFWFFNKPPASIFMGDSGSHLLGYFAAMLSSSVTYFSHVDSMTKLPVLVPIFILAVPLFDTLAVVVIRLCKGKPIYVGDHNHISHRFVRMGMTRKRAVQMVHLLALIIGLSVLPILWGSLKVAIVCLIQAVLLLLLVSMLQYAVTIGASESHTLRKD
ncbi:MAG: undecaprenyl/decaprenyl-phosphate alpha-N-acetylglucosaminyl 1-phosphate transferase [Lentisphaerae bacterium]|nr:undecaprenyl/decaprenyl-phosphate alpha-N-acetylglucosaminyl 1-phosphate transferase [Lentisphaerota bacterium]MCP4100367.1 undecaprenyl/decaprenyl-phosphate alpha-N-acetylglucosaminyl 1-phosphate transferase [Lentisphaerota bacterium]